MADSDSTRDRIITAARAEFALHGIAGARIDRIAKSARTSKERVYAHFRSKEELYGHVASVELAAAADAVQMDPADLPAYAGRLFDYFVAHPDRHRFVAWGRLELATPAGLMSPIQNVVLGKIERLRLAQEAGDLDPTWDPVDILALVTQIANTWTDLSELARHTPEGPTGPARRAAVVRAVATLFPPAR